MVKLAWLAAGVLPLATSANPLNSKEDVANGSFFVSIARNNVQAAAEPSHLPQSTSKVLSHVAVPMKDSETVNATLFGHDSDTASPVKHQVLVAVLPLASTTVSASTTVLGPVTGTLDALSILCAAMATPPTYCQAVPSATATSATESTATPVSSGAASSAQATMTTTASIVSGPTSGASTAASETSRGASSAATTARPSSAASSTASGSASGTESSNSGSSAATSATSTASSTLSTTTSSATAAGTVVPPVPAVAGSAAAASVPLFVTELAVSILGAMLLL